VIHTITWKQHKLVKTIQVLDKSNKQIQKKGNVKIIMALLSDKVAHNVFTTIQQNPIISLPEICKKTGLANASVHRALKKLKDAKLIFSNKESKRDIRLRKSFEKKLYTETKRNTELYFTIYGDIRISVKCLKATCEFIIDKHMFEKNLETKKLKLVINN